MRKLICFLLFFISFSVYTEDKPIMTVLDFRTEGVSKSEMRSIISFLSSALFGTDKFVIIDVQERETLLEEMEFSMGSCSDDACLLKIGRLLSAEYIVTGDIGKVGTRYLLSIKMLETETGRTINSVEGVYKNIDGIVDDLYNLAANLAKIKREDIVEDTEDTVITMEDNKEEDTVTDDTIKDDITPDDIIADDTVSPDDSDSSEATDRDKKTIGSPRMAIGVGAGITIPFGDLNIALGNTYTPLVYIDVRYNLKKGYFGCGLLTGYQPNNTTSDYLAPEYAYKLLSIPIAFHSHLAITFAKKLFFSLDASGGVTVNNINYTGEEMDDILTSKLFFSPGIGLGLIFGSHFNMYLYNNIFIIAFNKNAYIADSIGLVLELNY